MLPFTNAACAVVFWATCGIWGVSEFIRGSIYRVGKGAKRQDRGSRLLLYVTIACGIAVAIRLVHILPSAAIAGNSLVVFYSGIALMVAGMVFRWYAVRVLGRFFTFEVSVRPDHQVVQSGPYRLIRHPSYTGSLITLAGVGLASTNWASLAALLIISSIGMAYRIHIEEQLLSEELGQPYQEYMKRTRRLIPFLF